MVSMLNGGGLLSGGGTGKVSPYFKLVSLMPTVVLIFVVGTILLSGPPRHSPSPHRAWEAAKTITTKETLIVVFAATIISIMLHPLQFSLIKVIEGYYWDSNEVGKLLAKAARARHKRQYMALERKIRQARDTEDRAAAQERLKNYPDFSRVLPTTLGNTLRSAEDKAGERYGLDTVGATPRLYMVLSPPVLRQVNSFRSQLDVATRFCAVWLVTTVVALALLVPYGAWSFVGLGTFLLAWVSYRSAIGAAAGYGEMLGVAFDLHRFDLMRAMHVPLPRTWGEEIQVNAVLTGILLGWPEDVTSPLSDAQGDVTSSSSAQYREFRYQHDWPDIYPPLALASTVATRSSGPRPGHHVHRGLR